MIQNFIKPLNILTYVGIAAGGYYFYTKIKKDNPGDLETPSDYGTLPKGPISKASAKIIADTIWDSLGYAYVNWDKIATEFEKLRNDEDMKGVWNAFGVRRGYVYSGNLWKALNDAYESDYIGRRIHTQDLASIKVHAYKYKGNLKWK